ncbi:MAG: hypoxanthine phosphoribosyltransferase [Phycisphaeraceae bacterium]
MQTHIDRVLLDRKTIAHRVEELADEIARDFAAPGSSDPQAGNTHMELVLVPLLTGSIIFLADLVRKMPLMMRMRMLSISSYPGKSTASHGVTIHPPMPTDLAGKHVLIVDDILDSGRSVTAVRQLIAQQNPASVRVCVLLRKKIPSALAVPADYIGFDIPDEFVVGYGLDYDGYYRNLPEVCTLKAEAIH